MRERDALASLVQGWVEKADHDLIAARQILKLGDSSPTEAVCFHVQQCVEKYLKAMLVAIQAIVPKIHDIENLVSLLPRELRPNLGVDLQRKLTGFAVEPRYPDEPSPSLAEARAAVALARRVRREVRRKLPKEALRHPRSRAK
jgi:HEPN domain-containing protein